MNMTVLFKKYTYGLLLIATTLIGYASNFTNADFDITTLNQTFTVQNTGYLIPYDMQYYPGCSVGVQSTGNNLVVYNSVYSFNQYSYSNELKILSPGDYYIYQYNGSCMTNKFKFVELGQNNGNNENTCNPSGSCTVNNKVNDNIKFSGSKSFSSAGYTNMFNYGNEGAGTYCVNFTSTSPQQLTMGFANGGNTAPSNLYTLYADQYGNTICLYGNKPYFNIKLNSSSNTINYEVYKLTDLLNDNIPCEETEQETCDYTQYENTINNLSGSLAQCQSENNTLSGNLNTCEGELNSCMSGFGTGDIQRSALFINNIQHLGANRINITIPEEIEREYTNEEDTFNLDVEGYGYDQEKMQSIVNTQFTPPTSEDIENVIKRIADFMPLLAIMLLIVYAWWLIKKVF